MSKEKAPNEYDVGYGKPPKNSQFKKGVSGNPRGRPKRRVDFDQLLLHEASLPVIVNENGRPVRISKQAVAIKQLINKALKGDMYAMRIFFGYHQQASERIAILAAQKKSTDTRRRDVNKLTDQELLDLIDGIGDEE